MRRWLNRFMEGDALPSPFGLPFMRPRRRRRMKGRALAWSQSSLARTRRSAPLLFLLFQSIAPEIASAATKSEITEEIQLPQKTVELTIQDKSFFTDRVATATAYFDTIVSAPDYQSRESDTCAVIDIRVLETPDSDQGQSAAMLRFLPRQAGIVTLPALEFSSPAFQYLTEPQQVIVSEPIRSPDMSLTLQPEKLKIYVGEPLRIHLTWDCSLNAGTLKALDLNPAFFQEPNIEVLIPRSADEEKHQLGMPIGGRRAIARRMKNPEKTKALGQVTLPIYLRFSQPGRFTLPETRLECAQMAKSQGGLGRYAAYFNNSLYETAETSQSFDRVFTTAAPIEIEVLPLPPGQGPTFSGLFQPLQIDVSARPTEVAIGDLMELEVKLSGEAPHGMIELPPLSQQPALRGRFLVDDDYDRLWHEKGSAFRARLRVLSTSVQAFPSLQLQVFDPGSGRYVMRSTQAIPLKVKPSNGQEFIALKSFEGATATLTNQPEGIWHNLEANPVNDLLDRLYSFILIAFWPLLILGPVAFALLRPLAQTRRRHALDPRHRLRARAYADFKKPSANSREKWTAFLRFMAITFDAGDKAWTRRDSEAGLQKVGADQADLEALVAMHKAADAEDFSQQGEQARFKNLDGLARRIMRLAARSALLCLLAAMLAPQPARADEWSDAEQLFAQAQAATAGSKAANALYQNAALKFQAAAHARQRQGEAWYNAGNAWFQAGTIGRAIAAYRQAELHRPFDARVADNLAAARAMTLNDLPQVRGWSRRLPLNWLKVTVVLLNLLLWGLLLFTLRYRQRGWYAASTVIAATLLLVSIFSIQKSWTTKQAGTVIVDAIFGKKGPGYAFANAFNEPLRDGLELILIEQRKGWGLAQLPDTRQCWLPLSQIQLIKQ